MPKRADIQGSNDFKRLNPHLYLNQLSPSVAMPPPYATDVSKRLKQSSEPLMNKLEAEYFAILNAQYLTYPRPRAQAKRYRLGNGVNYTPDFTASSWPDDFSDLGFKETAWEVKGKHSWDDAIVKIKMAATVWPEINWWFCWKDERGQWKLQLVLP